MEAKIVIPEVVKASWRYLKSQVWVLVGLFTGYILLYMIFWGIQLYTPPSSVTRLFMSLVLALFSLVFYLGYYKNIFQTMDGEEPQFSAYGQQARKFFATFIGGILFAAIFIIGLILLVLPGIYMAIRLQFYVAAIVDDDMGAIDALKHSWDITRGQSLPLILLAFVMVLVLIIGAVLFGIGLLIAAPMLYIMQCYVYRLLNRPLAIPEE
ncbi:MAG: hypothetical protein LUG51_12715 [Tannerellaceae bacterium]|nr:hypothetical protein [Tannerellaceae bacterium]